MLHLPYPYPDKMSYYNIYTYILIYISIMINKLDKDISYLIYSLVNSNNFIRNIPYYLGLLPYELYVIPGMYLAIIQVLWLNTPNPIQFHLLPHWFAYSLFTFLKNASHFNCL